MMRPADEKLPQVFPRAAREWRRQARCTVRSKTAWPPIAASSERKLRLLAGVNNRLNTTPAAYSALRSSTIVSRIASTACPLATLPLRDARRIRPDVPDVSMARANGPVAVRLRLTQVPQPRLAAGMGRETSAPVRRWALSSSRAVGRPMARNARDRHASFAWGCIRPRAETARSHASIETQSENSGPSPAARPGHAPRAYRVGSGSISPAIGQETWRHVQAPGAARRPLHR